MSDRLDLIVPASTFRRQPRSHEPSRGALPGAGWPGEVASFVPVRGRRASPGPSAGCLSCSSGSAARRRIASVTARQVGFGGTSCQRRRNSISLAYSLPVRLARTRMWAATFLKLRERPLGQAGSIVAVAAVHGEDLAAGQRIFVAVAGLRFLRRGRHAQRCRPLRVFRGIDRSIITTRRCQSRR